MFKFAILFLITANIGKVFSVNDIFNEELYESVLNTAVCERHIKEINTFAFFDASFRIPQSITLGGQDSLGNYDQCLKTRQVLPEDVIEGKYCLIQLTLDEIPILNLTYWGWHDIRHNNRTPELSYMIPHASFRLAVCIPKTCTVQQVVGTYLEPLNVTLGENYCRLPNDKVYSFVDWIAMFSNVPGAIECLDGIRSISILWVLLGHSFSTSVNGSLVNPFDAFEWSKSWKAIWVTAANLSVDSFFMMSGLLVVYTTANKLTQRSLIKNIHWFYLLRLLRMFPLLATVVLLQASILHHVADGPNWNNFVSHMRSCRQWWWVNLLHVQNYVKSTDICLPHSWYLSVDTQLHVISPLVLYWVLGGRRSATIGLTSGLLISLLIAIIYCYTYDFSGLSFYGLTENMDNNFKAYYANTLTRSPPLFVGMILGYLLHVSRNQRVYIPAFFVNGTWVAAAVLASSMIYLHHPELVFNRFWLNLLNAIMRPLWALSLTWLVFACVHGYGGPVNWFLTLKVWKFVSRVSYALYLCHYPLQLVLRAAAPTPFFFTVTNLISIYISDVVFSLLFAIILCILVDAPFSTLLKVILEPKKQRYPKGNQEKN